MLSAPLSFRFRQNDWVQERFPSLSRRGRLSIPRSELRKAGRVECTRRSVGVLRSLPAGEIGLVVVAQSLGSPEAQRAAVAVNENTILALGLVDVLDDRLPRLALLVLPGLRGRHFRFS